MNIQQALQIIKQALDAGVKMGVCPTIDAAGILAQAWQIITNNVKNDK